MNGICELADRTRDEEVIAMEALKSLSDGQRARPSAFESAPVLAQRQVELQGRFSRMQSKLQQEAGFSQQCGLRGVWFNRKSGRWHANIGAVGRTINLGNYASEEEAARLYDMAALRIRGQKANLNFPLSDYLLPDGTVALDLQVEAILLEAFLGRDTNDDLGGSLVQQVTSPNSDEATVSSASVGDLVRLCLGRINRADRAELQEAALALGPGYMQLMSLITDAGQVLAASGSGGGGSGGGASASFSGRARHDVDGGGAGEGGGGESEWPPERVENCRSPGNSQLQTSQHQQRGGWQGQARTGAPAPASEAPGHSATENLRPNSTRNQQQSHVAQEAQQQHRYLQHQHQKHQQHAPLSQHQLPQQQLLQKSPQIQPDTQERPALLLTQSYAKDVDTQHPRRDVDIEGSPPPRDLPDRVRGLRNQAETGGSGGGTTASMDTSEACTTRGIASGAAGGMSTAMTSTEKKTHYQSEVVQSACSLLRSTIQQFQSRQRQSDGVRAQPSAVQAVAHLVSTGIPAALMLQAADTLMRSRLLSYKDYVALDAWSSERGPASTQKAAAHADALPSSFQQQQQQQQQSYHSHQQPRQMQAPLETILDSVPVAATAALAGGAAAQGLSRGFSTGSLKRKSVDAATGAAAAAGGSRGDQPSGVGTPTPSAAYANDDLQPSAKRLHCQRMADAPTGPAQLVVTPGAAGGPASRQVGADVNSGVDMTTSIAMAAAVAAASTAGGVPIGIPAAPHEQARAAAAIAAASAALAAPVAPPQMARAQMTLTAMPAAPSLSAEGIPPASVQPTASDGRATRSMSGGAGGGTVRQPIGLGRRLFNAIATQLPPGAELDCLLPPKFGYVGVLYILSSGTRVGAALWDGGEVVNLGVYSSDRDARQAVASSSSIANRVATPSLAVAQPTAAAVPATRRLTTNALAATGGLVMAKPSVITTGPSGSAGSPSGGALGHPGVNSSGGGGGVGTHTMLIRPLPGGSGGGALATAPSTKSLLSGARSSLAPLSQDASAAAALQPAGSGIRSRQEQVLTARGPQGSSAGPGELEAVASNLPKGPVIGPILLGPPEVALDGSLQLVCQLFVQQDEPLSSDDLNNVIAQKITAANLQSLLDMAGSDPMLAAAAVAAANAAAASTMDQQPWRPSSGTVPATGGVGAQIGTTVTTIQTGTNQAPASEFQAAEPARVHHHSHQPAVPAQKNIGLYSQQQQQQQLAVAAPPPAQRAPYSAAGMTATTALPQGSPPMPFALRDASPQDREREVDRERDRDVTDCHSEGLVDADSVRGPLQLLLPTVSQQLPTSLALSQHQPLYHSNQPSLYFGQLPSQQPRSNLQVTTTSSRAVLSGVPLGFGGGGGGSGAATGATAVVTGGTGGAGAPPQQRRLRLQVAAPEAAGAMVTEYDHDSQRENVGREEPQQQDQVPPRQMTPATAVPGVGAGAAMKTQGQKRGTSRLMKRASGGSGEIAPYPNTSPLPSRIYGTVANAAPQTAIGRIPPSVAAAATAAAAAAAESKSLGPVSPAEQLQPRRETASTVAAGSHQLRRQSSGSREALPRARGGGSADVRESDMEGGDSGEAGDEGAEARTPSPQCTPIVEETEAVPLEVYSESRTPTAFKGYANRVAGTGSLEGDPAKAGGGEAVATNTAGQQIAPAAAVAPPPPPLCTGSSTAVQSAAAHRVTKAQGTGDDAPTARPRGDPLYTDSMSVFAGRVRSMLSLGVDGASGGGAVGVAAVLEDPLESKPPVCWSVLEEHGRETARSADPGAASGAAVSGAEYGAVRKLVGVSVRDALVLTQIPHHELQAAAAGKQLHRPRRQLYDAASLAGTAQQQRRQSSSDC